MQQSQQEQAIRIELTEEQRKQVRAATGKDAAGLELSVDELEERILPFVRWR
jgi:uncharacterized small protein (DUF1192 family)